MSVERNTNCNVRAEVPNQAAKCALRVMYQDIYQPYLIDSEACLFPTTSKDRCPLAQLVEQRRQGKTIISPKKE